MEDILLIIYAVNSYEYDIYNMTSHSLPSVMLCFILCYVFMEVPVV